jgi:hypothetical protein
VDLLLTLVLVAIASLAGGMLAFGEADRVGVAGTLLGGVLGFLTASAVERTRRGHEDAHRFEQERRAVYVRLLEAVSVAEDFIGDRRVAALVNREYTDLDPEMPSRPDLKPADLLVHEIRLLAPFSVYMSAYVFTGALSSLDDGVGADEEKWLKLSGDLFSARTLFVKRAKVDLGTPSGVMSGWQERRYRLRRRLRREKPKPPSRSSRPSGKGPHRALRSFRRMGRAPGVRGPTPLRR